MYLLYLDESGHSNIKNPLKFPEGDFFVLGGVIVKEENYHTCNEEFRKFKRTNFPKLVADLPIHAVELNNIGHSSNNRYDGHLTPAEGKELLKRIYDFINGCKIEVIVVVIDNIALRKQYVRPENPYVLAYEFLLEKFAKIVEGRDDVHNQIGLVNLAQSSEKLHQNLKLVHKHAKTHGTTYVKDYTKILPMLNIEPMESSSYYEIADLVCYAFQRHYYGWLCTHLGKQNNGEGYVFHIKAICTLDIGQAFFGHKEDSVRLKLFPSYERILSHRGFEEQPQEKKESA